MVAVQHFTADEYFDETSTVIVDESFDQTGSSEFNIGVDEQRNGPDCFRLIDASSPMQPGRPSAPLSSYRFS